MRGTYIKTDREGKEYILLLHLPAKAGALSNPETSRHRSHASAHVLVTAGTITCLGQAALAAVLRLVFTCTGTADEASHGEGADVTSGE